MQHLMKPDQLTLCATLRRGHLTTPKLAELPNVARKKRKDYAFRRQFNERAAQGMLPLICSH